MAYVGLDIVPTSNGSMVGIDTLIETLENLKDAMLSIDVPNIEPFPEPEMLPDPESEQPARPEAYPYSNDLPF